MILNSLGQSTGHKEAVGMPTLHIGSRISEELIPKVKGCTFIVMGDGIKTGFFLPVCDLTQIDFLV